MSIAIEKIDLLMERAKIGYKEARDILEQFDGNVVEALVYLENNQKTTRYHQKRQVYQPTQSILSKLSDSIARMHAIRFTLANKIRKILDLPLTVAALLLLVALPVSLPLLIVALISGYKMSLIQPDGKNVSFTEAFNIGEAPPNTKK